MDDALIQSIIDMLNDGMTPIEIVGKINYYEVTLRSVGNIKWNLKCEAVFDDCLNNDATIEEIVEKHGITKCTLKHILSEHGINGRGGDKKLPSDLCDDEKAMIIDMYSSGDTVEEVAVKLNFTRRFITDLLRENGVKLRGRGASPRLRFSPEDEDAIVGAYIGGRSSEKIAIDRKCSTKVILRLLRDKGVTIRNSGSITHIFTDDDRVDVVNKYVSGQRIHDIAVEYNVDHRRISAIVKAAGIKPTKGHHPFSEALMGEN